MAPSLAFSPDVAAAAIIEAKGMMTVAADRLGCNPMTLYRYRDRYAVVRAAILESRERMRDVAENVLFNKVIEGDLPAVTFYLSTQAKERGYVRREEHSGPDGAPMEFTFVIQRPRLEEGG